MPAAIAAPHPLKDGGFRPAYKVSELLALRESISDDAVPLDKFGTEEAIKEHVLRPTASGSLVQQSNVEKMISSKRPSPTPSVKRGKVEKLIKEHGSPPGVRVTAAGRVVPASTNPGSANVQFRSPSIVATTRDGMIVAPAPLSQLSLMEGYCAYNMQGQFCQVNNGKLIPLEVSTYGTPKYLKVPANSFPVASSSLQNMMEDQNRHIQAVPHYEAVGIPIETRMEQIEKEMSETKTTLNQLERQNVFANWKPPEKLVFVTRKKELILRIDNLRKELSKLEQQQAAGFLYVLGSTIDSNATVNGTHPPTLTSTTSLPPIVPAPNLKKAQGVATDTRKNANSSDTDGNTRARESHAVPIIPPKSRLNPASPEFQPPQLVLSGMSSSPEQAGGILLPPLIESTDKELGGVSQSQLSDTRDHQAGGVSLSANMDTLYKQAAKLTLPKGVSRSEDSGKPKKINQKSSSSSFNTVDFFPTAPEEHSLSRFATVPETSVTPQKQIATLENLADAEFNRSELNREERRGYDSAIRSERLAEGHSRGWVNGYAMGCYNMLIRFRLQYRALERTHRDMQSILARMYPRDVTVSSAPLPENTRIISPVSASSIQNRIVTSVSTSPIALLPSHHSGIATHFANRIPVEAQHAGNASEKMMLVNPVGSTGPGIKDGILKSLSSRASNARTTQTSSIQRTSNDSDARSTSMTPHASPASPRPSPIRSPSRLSRFHIRRSHSSQSNDRQNNLPGSSSPANNASTSLGGRLFRSRH